MIRVGAQGWNYDAWVGPFYPTGTRAVDYLGIYARAFDTVEVDSTFYGIPSAKTVRAWATRTPESFAFTLKLPQEITHERRLRDSGDVLVRFLEVARELGPKLGAILIQCAPSFGPAELPALAAFLPLLPPDLHFAIEFRDRGWINEGVIALLTEHRVALTLSDGRWIPRNTVMKLAEQPTSDIAYVRWMGPDQSIVDYSRLQVDRSAEIARWSETLRQLQQRVSTTFCFFNNHYAGHSPASIRMLQEKLGQVPVDPAQLGDQLGLF